MRNLNGSTMYDIIKSEEKIKSLEQRIFWDLREKVGLLQKKYKERVNFMESSSFNPLNKNYTPEKTC